MQATTAASQNDDWGLILEVAENYADIIVQYKYGVYMSKCLKLRNA